MTEVYQVKRMSSPANWVVEVPGSKSITNRALLMAALAQGKVTLEGALFSDDSRYFVSSLKSLGFQVNADEENKIIELKGTGGMIPARTGGIYVGSAGTAARFLTAFLGVSRGKYTIRASQQMAKRPMRPLFEVLISLGAKIDFLERKWHLPVEITGAGEQIASRSEPERIRLDIGKSTQFLSALLLVAPMFPHGLQIEITGEKKSGSYIRITQKMMEQFGTAAIFDGSSYQIPAASAYCRERYRIEPDMSAACYFYAAAAVTGGYALVRNIHGDCMQGDLKFLSVLREMGCAVRDEEAGISVTGPADGTLRGISVDMNDFSDQALTLAAIAPYADGEVHIRHVAHIRAQESDRIRAIADNLARAGIWCREEPDGIRIRPGKPQPCSVATYDDHRVAMAFSLLGLLTDGIVIENPSCCKKTFENYFELLDELTQG